MSSTVLPFLYQTRTIQRAFGSVRTRNVLRFARLVHVPARRGATRKMDETIPFEWDDNKPHESIDNDVTTEKVSTITPSEAEIFKGIFDEIAQSRMPLAKKRPAKSATTTPSSSSPPLEAREATKGMARSLVEQARVKEFREKFLSRYPSSLRSAAQIALGLYELELEPNPGSRLGTSKMIELDEADKAKWEERAKYQRLREEERERVDALMKACDTDAALWRVMEAEVFSLPAQLGIAKEPKKKPKSRTSKAAAKTDDPPPAAEATDEKRSMDVHGPLYTHFIDAGLALFDTAFARPSEYAFAILPRVKSLGLPSYVLGVSSPFYTRLARMHWTRFGDAAAALDILQEMSSAGLYADESTHELLVMMQEHLHGLAWGAQGPFVKGMMDAPPYDASLAQRLEEMEQYAAQSMDEAVAEFPAV
ncbi:hypothetical protein E4U17_003989 [Claviceps sp. LM77 group G4]|nr:hypothetical protein E4U17_003989 [Claviceps sp. LM77 group G4]KAG6080768.1 hypothetical protein E4U16_008160 [Claviceps sp. LM84 group G4]KAG6082167.1 hypothetical protein E4U33_005959 [Claviceps sp. LM78 group G4]